MNLFIRTDANTQIGTGHLMRCLALAQAWQDRGGEVVFAIATSAPSLLARIEAEGMKVVCLSVEQGSIEDAKETARLAHQLEAVWVVVDSYHFGAEYQQIIKDSGLRFLFIDDYGHAQYYCADIVLNQNIYAHEDLYPNRSPSTQLLLGTRYVLLRREFWQWQGWKREIPSVARKILVTLGGGDPDNVTLKVVQALQLLEMKGLEAVVVVGGSNPHYSQLQAAVEKSWFPIRLVKNVTNMTKLMAWADVAISAGGSTVWELAFMGLPSILLVLADNQKLIAEKLGQIEVVVNLGWHENAAFEEVARATAKFLVAEKNRKEITQLAQELVNGEGGIRVAKALASNSGVINENFVSRK